MYIYGPFLLSSLLAACSEADPGADTAAPADAHIPALADPGVEAALPADALVVPEEDLLERLPAPEGERDAASTPCSIGVDANGWPVIAGGSCQMDLGLLSGQVVTFINAYTGQCLDVAGGSKSDNAAINQYPCHYGANQRFLVDSTTDVTVLKPTHTSGKCLDIFNGSTASGAKLQQFGCHYGTNQRFSWNETTNELIPKHSGKCIDVPGAVSTPGIQMQQFTCHSGPNQRWNVYSWTTGYYYP